MSITEKMCSSLAKVLTKSSSQAGLRQTSTAREDPRVRLIHARPCPLERANSLGQTRSVPVSRLIQWEILLGLTVEE